MEKKARVVVYSEKALEDLNNIYSYGIEAFSPNLAETFISELLEVTDNLSNTYLLHTECRYLPTKSQKYRTLIFYAYHIIYRITAARIEVLIIVRSSQSISTLKGARKIKIP
jgi:plasmid stabilization system protein ParE